MYIPYGDQAFTYRRLYTSLTCFEVSLEELDG
jgi:hypothetical protein